VPVIGTVQIGNTAANAARVLDVTNPAAQPYHSRVIVSLGPGEFVDDEDLEPVPPGKRLVLEYASVNAQLPIGQRLVVSVLAVNAGLSIPVVFQGTFQNTADLFVGSEPVRFYLNGGETPRVSAARSENGGNGSVQVNVSGHLVDL
jgi:hypothetical protein